MHRRISQLARLGVICLTIVSVWACDSLLGSDDSNGTGGGGELAFLDIAGAEALFIAPGSGSQSSLSASVTDVSTNTLFQITANGFVQEVTFLDLENNEVTLTNLPTEIYDVNSAYVIVLFGEDGYLVRKSDGAAFSLDDVGIPAAVSAQLNNFINAPIIQTDGAGNLYYQNLSDLGSATGDVVRIDVSDPSRLTGEAYVTEANASVDNFFVSSDEHVIYHYGNAANSVRGNRIRKANGGLQNLSSDIALFFWIGNDGNIKYHWYDSDTSTSRLFTVTIAADGTFSQTEVVGVNLLTSFQSYLFRFNASTVAVDIFNNAVYELENATDTPREITTITGVDDFDYAVASTDYYYIAGDNSTNQPVFIRVDPRDDTSSSILTAGEYDVYRAVVANDGTITFNAQRMNDGAIVLGEISPTDNRVTILNEDLNDEVIELIRVN